MAKYIKIPILFIISFFLLCSNNNPVELINVLNGTWVEVYDCDNVKCDNAFDSLQISVLIISGSNFSSILYKDSEQAHYDTSFSGKISITSDTLQFILSHFREVFFWRFQNRRLLLKSVYSIDVNDNKIADFRSILWCCDVKKRGFFE